MKILAFLLTLLSLSCYADSVHFDNIKASDLSAFLYGELLRENYVMTQDVINKTDLLRVHFDGLEKEKIAASIKSVLSGVGIEQKM
jgi:hypothetical protein